MSEQSVKYQDIEDKIGEKYKSDVLIGFGGIFGSILAFIFFNPAIALALMFMGAFTTGMFIEDWLLLDKIGYYDWKKEKYRNKVVLQK